MPDGNDQKTGTRVPTARTAPTIGPVDPALPDGRTPQSETTTTTTALRTAGRNVTKRTALRPATPPAPVTPEPEPEVEQERVGRPTRWRGRAARVVIAVIAVLMLVGSVYGVGASSQAPSELARPTPGRSGGSSTTSAPATTVVAGAGALSGLLVTPRNQALYYNEQDTAVSIECAADCTPVWRPLLLADGATPSAGAGVSGVLGTVRRPDGGTQVTYDGHPLYTFAVDAPGHSTGDGTFDLLGGVGFAWHAAPVSGVVTAPPAPITVNPAPLSASPSPTPTPTGRTSPTPTVHA